jgi:large subunit ribosomal protein L5
MAQETKKKTEKKTASSSKASPSKTKSPTIKDKKISESKSKKPSSVDSKAKKPVVKKVEETKNVTKKVETTVEKKAVEATKSEKTSKDVKKEMDKKEVAVKPIEEKQPKVEKVKTETSEKEVVIKGKEKGSSKAIKIHARLRDYYFDNIVATLMKKHQYKSIMEVPMLHKIVINIGVGDANLNPKLLEDSVRDLSVITGQKPVITKAKISVANFKLREGQAIGCKVTLRGERMYHFFDKLINIALPRVRDFRGVSKNSFDGRGNYTFGVKEQLIFPEIDFDKVTRVRGMDIIVVTTAKTDAEAFSLLSELGVPFQK